VHDIFQELKDRFYGDAILGTQQTKDGVLTVWVSPARTPDVLAYLKNIISQPFKMLYDLTAIDERAREHREGQPDSDFTVVYHLLRMCVLRCH